MFKLCRTLTQISIGADDTTNQRFYIDDVVIKR